MLGVGERAMFKAFARWRAQAQAEASADTDNLDAVLDDLVAETARRAAAGEPQDFSGGGEQGDERTSEGYRPRFAFVDQPPEDAILAAERGEDGFDPVLTGFAVSQVSSTIDARTGEAKRHFVQQRKARGEAFELPPGQEIGGVSFLEDSEGRKVLKWTKTKTKATADIDIVGILKEALVNTPVAIPPILAPSVVEEDYLTVYPIADPHFGMLAWGKETGQPYDLAIAEAILTRSARDLMVASPPSKEAVVLGLGDWFHTNDSKNVTPASGHLLDVDTRHDKAFLVGVEVAISIIDMALHKHERVIVRMLKGNHDSDPAFALSVGIAMRYRKNPRVEVDLSPALHWCHQFGEVMLVASHGHAVKAAQIAGFAAAKWPKIWGATEHRYAYLGHIHSRLDVQAKDAPGMLARHFRTVNPGDSWSVGNGYFSGRSLVSITLHRRTGKRFETTINLSSEAIPEAA